MLEVKEQIAGVKGFRVAGLHTGLKKNGQPDMTLILADRNCATGAVFTTNLVKAAPVLLCEKRLQAGPGTLRAVIINTTCANAATGAAGLANAETMTRWVAEQAQIQPEQVLVMSTGVIGTQLPMEKIQPGIEKLFQNLGHNWEQAARGIMTTDTRPKLAALRVLTAGGEYTIAGISKGAGMIAPNMATMLGVIVTDARMNAAQAQSLLASAVKTTYNRIVVDGDTSTNDMVTLLASGASGVLLDTATEMLQFQQALTLVCRSLAQQVVRDGEGASKFITLEVLGAPDDASAAQIAHTIAASPLVKTAFAGNDANWGRIMAAAGRAGVAFNPEAARLWFAPGEELFEADRGLLLFEHGMPARYSEQEATAIVSEDAVYVSLDCGSGRGQAIVWTCDLTHAYVDINGSYRS
ncbi:MAG: bifunctional glutamate N-acetyltransferase/amino-acid acetyltransferase ArgJ [Anaerolineae bacterium]|nr:bifunctional glutamate N-acetyltransferase/amino-acid acetyltransferase ArgJ [Anaerolineae bacterium]